MKEHRDVAAARLCLAADAILEAFWQMAAEAVRVYPYPPDLLGSPECPSCLYSFSSDELAEATEFLLRLGMLSRA